jgi:hypothetical protein
LSLSIRHIPESACLSDHLAFDALARVVTPEVVADVIEQCGVREERRRKLPAAVMLVFCIAMNVYAGESLSHVFRQVVHGLRWLWPVESALRVSKGALSQGRYRLGARPVVRLFHHVCRPLAIPTTPGAFVGSYRLMAIDSEVLNLADTASNDRAFGRSCNKNGSAAWPQAQLVGLVEAGTHAMVDAGLWPYHADLHAAARRLLRSVGPAMLVSWDQGLHSHALIAATRARRAHVLARLPAGARPTPVRTLADGTQLARILPVSGFHRRQRALLVRVMRYTFDDPQRPGAGEEHRLITTLLNPRVAPADTLVLAYHGRWEYELTIDEMETHQRPRAPLRSLKPVGVVQEVFGLLLAHYLTRAVMVDAAQRVDLPPTRLSFLTSLRLIRLAVSDFQRTTPGDHPLIYHHLLADLVATPLPPRTNRINPRVVKQKCSKFAVKRPLHYHWPQPTKSFRAAIVMLN